MTTNPVPANLIDVTDASVPVSYLGGTPPPVEVIGEVDAALTRAFEEVLLGGKTRPGGVYRRPGRAQRQPGIASSILPWVDSLLKRRRDGHPGAASLGSM